MPIECELMSVSPRQCEAPACQARRRFRHELRDAAGFVDHVMAGDAAFGAASQSIAFAADDMPV